jgi:hypothetical protein
LEESYSNKEVLEDSLFGCFISEEVLDNLDKLFQIAYDFNIPDDLLEECVQKDLSVEDRELIKEFCDYENLF